MEEERQKFEERQKYEKEQDEKEAREEREKAEAKENMIKLLETVKSINQRNTKLKRKKKLNKHICKNYKGKYGRVNKTKILNCNKNWRTKKKNNSLKSRQIGKKTKLKRKD